MKAIAPAPIEARRAALLVAFMWVAYFLNYCDRQAVFSMTGSLKTDLKMSDTQLGLVGAKVVIDCRDEGPGIEPDEIERIFDPFFQGRRRPPASAAGSGIGLAIVRELICAHRGRVCALPSEQGAHFRVELPHA